MTEEPLTYQGVPWVFDNPELPECGVCHENRRLPHTATLRIGGKVLDVPMCDSCGERIGKIVAALDKQQRS